MLFSFFYYYHQCYKSIALCKHLGELFRLSRTYIPHAGTGYWDKRHRHFNRHFDRFLKTSPRKFVPIYTFPDNVWEMAISLHTYQYLISPKPLIFANLIVKYSILLVSWFIFLERWGRMFFSCVCTICVDFSELPLCRLHSFFCLAYFLKLKMYFIYLLIYLPIF